MTHAAETNSSLIVVAVSDAKVSGNPSSTLATYSLGSCIGVCLYDPVVALAGLLHFQLPTSTLDAQRAKEKPLMFADTGLTLLVAEMERRGAVAKRMRVKLAGGAEMLDDGKTFNIGRRNHTAIRKALWQQGMLIDKEDVGGTSPRTVYLRVADGTLTIKSNSGQSTL